MLIGFRGVYARFCKSAAHCRSLMLRPFGTTAERGMTLLEIIIVVALLATLMGILVNNLLAPQENAQKDQARIQMGQIQQALQMYRVHNHRYPTTAQGLSALLTSPGEAKGWRGPYIEEKKLQDPWGQTFNYESDGRTLKIISAGPDQEGGTNDDIVYPEEQETAS